MAPRIRLRKVETAAMVRLLTKASMREALFSAFS